MNEALIQSLTAPAAPAVLLTIEDFPQPEATLKAGTGADPVQNPSVDPLVSFGACCRHASTYQVPPLGSRH